VNSIFEKIAQGILDNQKTALSELSSNRGDSGAYLKGLFNQAGAQEKADSKLVTKSFSGDFARETAQPLLKVANEIFADNKDKLSLLAAETPAYRQSAFLGFQRELEKIALSPMAFQALGKSLKPGASLSKAVRGPGSLGDMMRNQTAMAMPR
jgi:hypothetical protein